jgi:hypothetical protein
MNKDLLNIKYDDNTLYVHAMLNMIIGNYDEATELIRNIDDHSKLTSILSFLVIQIVIFAINNNDELFAVAYKTMDEIVSTSKSIGPSESDWVLAVAFFAAYRQELIPEETINKVINSINRKSTLYFIMKDVWVCTKDPDSEAAHKIMAEPPFAALVTKVSDLVAGVKKPAKRRGK